MSAGQYVRLFEWDFAKFAVRQRLPALVSLIQGSVGKIEEEHRNLSMVFAEKNQTMQVLATLQRRKKSGRWGGGVFRMLIYFVPLLWFLGYSGEKKGVCVPSNILFIAQGGCCESLFCCPRRMHVRIFVKLNLCIMMFQRCCLYLVKYLPCIFLLACMLYPFWNLFVFQVMY